MNNLITRILSGSIYVATIFLAIFSIPYTPFIFLASFGIFTVLGMWEINKITEEGDVKAPLISLIDILGGLGVFISFFLLHAGVAGSRSAWLLPLLLYFAIRIVVQLYMPAVNAIHSIQRSFMGIVYVAVPLGTLNTICAVEGGMMLLAVFCLLWLNDSGAYVFGSTLGKRKLFERISPHKSWEGFFGGLFTCVAFAIVASLYLNDFFNGPTNMAAWIGLGVVVSVFGTLGDLAESLMKRTAGVKDSGNLIPGHGGLLDRIDSMLLAAPASLIYFLILKYYI